MSRYSLVALLVLCCLSLAYRAIPQGPSMRLLVGPLNAQERAILEKQGASFQADPTGFSLRANDAGLRSLYSLREYHFAARDGNIALLEKGSQAPDSEDPRVEKARRQILENAKSAARLQQSRGSLFDEALRKLEKRDPNLLVWHAPYREIDDEAVQFMDTH